MAGTHEGRVIVFPQLTEVLTPFETKPQAKKILDADGGSITLMELAAGQSWHEHHSVHPVVVQVLKGKVDYSTKGQSIILCGDFNDTPLSYAYRTVCGSLSDAYAEAGVGPGISYNRSIFRFRIDHLLHSSDMRAYCATVDNRVRLSDHYPLWCVLEMGEETKD